VRVLNGDVMPYIGRVFLFALNLNFVAFGSQGVTCPGSSSLDLELKKQGTEQASSEVCDFVFAIQKELGLEDLCIEVRKFLPEAIEREKTVAMAMGNHHLFLDEKLFLMLTPEEQRFIIGHELIHLRNNHADKTLMGTAISGAVAMVMSLQVVQTLEKVFPQLSSYRPLLAATSVALGFYVSAYTYGSLSRRYEKEADMCAARELNCAQGGTVLFKRPVKVDSVLATQTIDPLALYKKAFDELIRTHPNRVERVAYLQSLSQVAPAA